jgi:hypothetical protein
MWRLTSVWFVAPVAVALSALGDEVDDAIAALERRSANVTVSDQRDVAMVTFSAIPLSEADIERLSTIRATHVTLEGDDFGDGGFPNWKG